MKRIKGFLIFSMCGLLFLNSRLAVSASSDTTVEGHTGIGNINIELTSHEKGSSAESIEERVIIPGETIYWENSVTNTANTAWIRVSVSFGSPEGQIPAEVEYVFDDQWIPSASGYWYLKKPLAKDETAAFETKILIPLDWTEEISGDSCRLSVHADAVQKDNFTPDFSAEDPWFGTLIEKSIADGSADSAVSDQNLSVMFMGGAEGMVHLGDDLFGNWDVLMPGDSKNGRVVIENRYSAPVRMYFSTSFLEGETLAEKVLLHIYRGEDEIYSGQLCGNVEEMTLGFYEPGDMSVFSYELEVPAELTNAYALQQSAVQWRFRAEVLQNAAGSRSPLTADHRYFGPIRLLIGGVLIIIVLLGKRKEKKCGKE